MKLQCITAGANDVLSWTPGEVYDAVLQRTGNYGNRVFGIYCDQDLVVGIEKLIESKVQRISVYEYGDIISYPGGVTFKLTER